MAESWVKVAAAPDESVALLMDGVLKDAGIPSLIQRAAGFDAPDFLSAGPRDMLVPASLVEEARQILEDTTGLGSYTPYRCCGSLPTSANSLAVEKVATEPI